MSVVADRGTVAISMEADCAEISCFGFAQTRYEQLNCAKYTQGMSILACPETLAGWRSEHRTARKRADRCARAGYAFAEVDLSRFNEDVWDINTSLEVRQGRPMGAGYLKRNPRGPLPDYPCSRHKIHTYGVLQGDRLRAYLSLYRVGDLALVSMILGHGAHLRDEIMFLLFEGVVADQAGAGGFFFYNRHDSGTEGLRWFKERLGFRETDIEWSLS